MLVRKDKEKYLSPGLSRRHAPKQSNNDQEYEPPKKKQIKEKASKQTRRETALIKLKNRENSVLSSLFGVSLFHPGSQTMDRSMF